jgi:hypothetical protein
MNGKVRPSRALRHAQGAQLSTGSEDVCGVGDGEFCAPGVEDVDAVDGVVGSTAEPPLLPPPQAARVARTRAAARPRGENMRFMGQLSFAMDEGERTGKEVKDGPRMRRPAPRHGSMLKL